MPQRPVTFVLPEVGRRAVGGYKVVYQYANHLAARGVEVTLCHFDDWGAVTRRAPDRWEAAAKRAATKAEIRLRRGPRWFALHPDVRLVAKRTPKAAAVPDGVVIATSWETAEFVNGIASSRGVPGYYFVQSLEDWSAPSLEVVNATWRLPLQKVVIAPWLLDHAHSLGEDAVLVANAIDGEGFPAGPPQEARPRRVVGLASTHVAKRLDVHVAVLTRVHELDPTVELVSFGVANRPSALPAHVRYEQEPSVSDLLQQARVYFCSSDREGWHLPPAEALMSGAAVVSSECGGVRAYADGIASFRSPEDTEGLASEILRLLDDPAAAGAMAADGRARLTGRSPGTAAAEFAAVVLGGAG